MVIEVNPLSTKSIEAAIKKIREYQNSLEGKCRLFVERLSEIGVDVIESTYKGKGDSGPQPKTDSQWVEGKTAELVLRVTGENLIFIEFGAGVHFNGPVGHAAYPLARELGFTIGSYSELGGNGKSLGQYDSWYYYDASGQRHESQGTEATSPVYNAATEMRNAIIQTAIEVFGKGG